MLKKLFCPLTILLAFLVCSGCNRDNRPADLPKLYPVILDITVDGQPLDNALVVLHAENEAIAKWTVGSVTDAAGKAIIVTHGQFQGAPEGKFKVCVRKVEMEGAEAMRQESQSGLVGGLTPAPSQMPKMVEYVDSLFGDPKTTILEIEIPASKKTTTMTLNVHKPK